MLVQIYAVCEALRIDETGKKFLDQSFVLNKEPISLKTERLRGLDPSFWVDLFTATPAAVWLSDFEEFSTFQESGAAKLSLKDVIHWAGNAYYWSNKLYEYHVKKLPTVTDFILSSHSIILKMEKKAPLTTTEQGDYPTKRLKELQQALKIKLQGDPQYCLENTGTVASCFKEDISYYKIEKMYSLIEGGRCNDLLAVLNNGATNNAYARSFYIPDHYLVMTNEMFQGKLNFFENMDKEQKIHKTLLGNAKQALNPLKEFDIFFKYDLDIYHAIRKRYVKFSPGKLNAWGTFLEGPFGINGDESKFSYCKAGAKEPFEIEQDWCASNCDPKNEETWNSDNKACASCVMDYDPSQNPSAISNNPKVLTPEQGIAYSKKIGALGTKDQQTVSRHLSRLSEREQVSFMKCFINEGMECVENYKGNYVTPEMDDFLDNQRTTRCNISHGYLGYTSIDLCLVEDIIKRPQYWHPAVTDEQRTPKRAQFVKDALDKGHNGCLLDVRSANVGEDIQYLHCKNQDSNYSPLQVNSDILANAKLKHNSFNESYAHYFYPSIYNPTEKQQQLLRKVELENKDIKRCSLIHNRENNQCFVSCFKKSTEKPVRMNSYGIIKQCLP